MNKFITILGIVIFSANIVAAAMAENLQALLGWTVALIYYLVIRSKKSHW